MSEEGWQRALDERLERVLMGTEGRCRRCGLANPTAKAGWLCERCQGAVDRETTRERERDASRGSLRKLSRTAAGLSRAGFFEDLGHCSFATWRGALPSGVKAWRESMRAEREVRPIVFHGRPGCGKSHLAVACALEAETLGLVPPGPIAWVSVPALGVAVRAAIAGEADLRELYAEAPLVVLDDAHRADGNSLAREARDEIAFRRSAKRLPTFVTANRNPLELYEGNVLTGAVGDAALWSRLLRGAVVVQVQAPVDRRLRPA